MGSHCNDPCSSGLYLSKMTKNSTIHPCCIIHSIQETRKQIWLYWVHIDGIPFDKSDAPSKKSWVTSVCQNCFINLSVSISHNTEATQEPFVMSLHCEWENNCIHAFNWLFIDRTFHYMVLFIQIPLCSMFMVPYVQQSHIKRNLCVSFFFPQQLADVLLRIFLQCMDSIKHVTFIKQDF